MSFKGQIEDKDTLTPPRPCQNLLSGTEELREALKRGHDHSTIRGMLEELEKGWKQAQRANLELSRHGGLMAHLEAYASALNAANEVMGQAKLTLLR